MLSLAQRLLSDVSASGYERLYCYGTSAGGLPALRFGILACAYRSISVGGTFSWDIYRLQQGKSVQCFDTLCVCNARPPGHMVCVHAGGAQRDTRAATRLQRIMRVSRIPVDGRDEHNIVYMIYKAGGLATFNAQLFDFDQRLLSISSSRSEGSPGTRARGAAGAPN
jgi:hypothetical protein